jgi:gp16 family phage-associated protein
MTCKSPRTCDEAKQWLERHGVTVTEWSKAHGFDPRVVFALLNGRTTGKWGQAYRAAVALGLRSAPDCAEPHPLEKQQTLQTVGN